MRGGELVSLQSSSMAVGDYEAGRIGGEVRQTQGGEMTYTTKELAEICRVTPRTIRNWINSGLVRASRLGGGRWRIPPAEIYKLKGVK